MVEVRDGHLSGDGRKLQVEFALEETVRKKLQVGCRKREDFRVLGTLTGPNFDMSREKRSSVIRGVSVLGTD